MRLLFSTFTSSASRFQQYTNVKYIFYEVSKTDKADKGKALPRQSRILNILPQTPQPLLRRLEHVVVLADGEADPILGEMRPLVGVELGRRDCGDAQLHDEEPGHAEVARAVPHVRREVVGRGQRDARKVGEHEVAALGLAVRQAQLGEDACEARHLALHLRHRRVPEVDVWLVGHFEAHGRCFLERGDGRVADPRVCCRDVFDQVGGSDEVPDAPAGGVEVLARGSDG